MLERLSKTWRNVALVAIAVLVCWFAWTVRSVLNPLILGYLLAYILRPLVQRLQDRGMKRRAAVNIIFVLFGVALVIIGGGIFVQGKQFVENQMRLAQTGEDPFSKAEKNIDALLGSAGEWFEATFRSDAADEAMGQGRDGGAKPAGDADGADGAGGESAPAEGAEGVDPDGVDPDSLAPDAGDDDRPADPADASTATGAVDAEERERSELTLRNLAKAWAAEWTTSDPEESGLAKAEVVLRTIQQVFGGVMSVLAFLVLLPVYTYFLLFELERIHGFVRDHIPKRERERVSRIGRSVGAVIANFFRGRLLICVLKGLVLAIGLSVLQLPYGFLLGMVGGFLSLIPFVGPTIGFFLTFLIAAQQMQGVESGIWLHLGLIGAVFGLAEFLEGYVFIPKVLGDSLGLHPVVILVSVFVGGAALGLFGFLIAIPLAATVIILFRELVMPAIEDFAEEDSHTA